MTHALPMNVPVEECSFTVAGLRLAYRVWGDPSKPTVLLQHGGKDHARSWDWTVAALADEYCLIAPDLRGHGDSDHVPGGGYSASDHLADLAMLMDELADRGFGRTLPLVGHSAGGNLVLRYGAAYPERVARIVSMEGLGFSQKSYDKVTATPLNERMRKAAERRLMLSKAPPRRFADPEEAVARMAGLHKQLHPDQARHLALHALTRAEEGGWRWKHDPVMGFLDPRPVPPSEYLPLYAQITCPVLLMYGRDSWATSPREDGRIEAFQNARLIEYKRAGHWLHHDRFEAFIADLRAFLAGNSAAI